MSEIDDYIAANHQRYTREAITQQLQDAGHSPEAIAQAWRRLEEQRAAESAVRGWRLGWREFFVLLAVGAVAVAIVWAPSRYGGPILAAMIYLVVVSLTLAVGKALSLAVDRGLAWLVAIVLLLAAAGSLFLAIQSADFVLPGLAAAVLGILGLALLVLPGRDRRAAGLVGAAIPVLAWLALTGTCISPLFTGGVT